MDKNCIGNDCPLCKAGLPRQVRVMVKDVVSGKTFWMTMPEKKYEQLLKWTTKSKF